MAKKDTTQKDLTQKVPCRACKSPIIQGATLCPVCKTYQPRWKSSVQYFATVGGLATVLIALATYVATTLPDLRKTFFPRERVMITSYSSVSNDIVISNFGDDDVWVSQMSCFCDTIHIATTTPINILVKANSFASKKLGKQLKEEKAYVTEGPYSKQQWQTILSMATNHGCLRWQRFTENSPPYLLLKQIYQLNNVPMQSLPMTCYISFFSLRHPHGIIQSTVNNMRAVPLIKDSAKCRARFGIVTPK